MNQLTEAMLKAIMPFTPRAKRLAALPLLNATAFQYGITNEKRLSAWLATLAVESGELKYQEEIASGAAYEGRKDLGNVMPGDGRKFKGHGRIQITGRANHASYTEYLRESGHLPFIDFVQNPKALAQEPYATDSAGWFFAQHIDANPLADAGQFLAIQIRVNGRNRKTGKPNHWQERQAYYQRALRIIPDDFDLIVDDALDASRLDGDALGSQDGYPDFDPIETPEEKTHEDTPAAAHTPATAAPEAQQEGKQPQAMAQTVQGETTATPAPVISKPGDTPVTVATSRVKSLWETLTTKLGIGVMLIIAFIQENPYLCAVIIAAIFAISYIAAKRSERHTELDKQAVELASRSDRYTVERK